MSTGGLAREALGQVVAAIQYDLGDLEMVRGRTGYTRGTAWTEWSGRLTDGTTTILRLRHQVIRGHGLIRSGFLLTRPLGQGGKTVEFGSATYEYAVDVACAEQRTIGDILDWLDQIKRREAVAVA